MSPLKLMKYNINRQVGMNLFYESKFNCGSYFCIVDQFTSSCIFFFTIIYPVELFLSNNVAIYLDRTIKLSIYPWVICQIMSIGHIRSGSSRVIRIPDYFGLSCFRIIRVSSSFGSSCFRVSSGRWLFLSTRVSSSSDHSGFRWFQVQVGFLRTTHMN